jgi:hypothetical protein
MSTTILSVISNATFVAIPLILISTGVVLLFNQPISTGSPLNNKVLSPPVEFTLDTL